MWKFSLLAFLSVFDQIWWIFLKEGSWRDAWLGIFALLGELLFCLLFFQSPHISIHVSLFRPFKISIWHLTFFIYSRHNILLHPSHPRIRDLRTFSPLISASYPQFMGCLVIHLEPNGLSLFSYFSCDDGIGQFQLGKKIHSLFNDKKIEKLFNSLWTLLLDFP